MPHFRCSSRQTRLRLKNAQKYHSWVAAGRIARFTTARICCSQILSFQDLFRSPFSSIKNRKPAITSRGFHLVPVLKSVWTFLYVHVTERSSRFSSQQVIIPYQLIVLQRILCLFLRKGISYCIAQYFIFTVDTKYVTRAFEIAFFNFFDFFN